MIGQHCVSWPKYLLMAKKKKKKKGFSRDFVPLFPKWFRVAHFFPFPEISFFPKSGLWRGGNLVSTGRGGLNLLLIFVLELKKGKGVPKGNGD